MNIENIIGYGSCILVYIVTIVFSVRDLVRRDKTKYLLILETKNKLSGGMKKQVNWLKLFGIHILMKLKLENMPVYYCRLKACAKTRLLEKI